MRRALALAVSSLAALAACGAVDPADEPAVDIVPVDTIAGGSPDAGPPISMDAIYTIPLDRADVAFVFSDPSAFGVDVVDFDVELTLRGGAKYEPPVRSPLNIGLLDTFAFGDFVLDAELQQTGREYGHRDLCVFFGHQAPDRFYYVHIATKADPNAHNVFLVDGAPRRNIASRTTEGIDWGASDSWHRVRVERRGAAIRVFFDDLETPIMEAEDATFGVGRVGFGSFDDQGRFRRIQIQGDLRPVPDTAPFAR